MSRKPSPLICCAICFVFLTLFFKDTRKDAQAVHARALELHEAGEDRDRAGKVMLSVCAVVLFAMMIHISVIFGG